MVSSASLSPKSEAPIRVPAHFPESIALIFVCLVTLPAQAGLSCDQLDLKKKFCEIKVEKNQIEVTKDQILVLQEGQLMAKENPFLASPAEWSKVEVEGGKGNWTLVFEAWDMPGSSGQELVRKIFRIDEKKFVQLSSQTLQKRVWNEETKSYQYSPKKK